MLVLLIISTLVIFALSYWRTYFNKITKKYIAIKIIRYLIAGIDLIWLGFLLFMGVGELLSGDTSGTGHILVAVPFGLILYLLIKTR